ncbi:hypothetical protein B0H67DRAFT_590945 [Lasiosphaeris hirsuta]|uniref:Uncharacterized protein n=1 Tax=Lasiosphaeris hirsuta TaxID=260670 RepID=A0AA40DPQ9_9PEZI|nr:hypothetical protein B0H67DRAFT_590945 [Lasiosphaeris hirsuta]
MPESDYVFTERVQLFPEGCLILADGDKVYSYAISHPICCAQLPALDSVLKEIFSRLPVALPRPISCRSTTLGHSGVDSVSKQERSIKSYERSSATTATTLSNVSQEFCCFRERLSLR